MMTRIIIERDALIAENAALKEQVAIEEANGRHWAEAYRRWATTDAGAKSLFEANKTINLLKEQVAQCNKDISFLIEAKESVWAGLMKRENQLSTLKSKSAALVDALEGASQEIVFEGCSYFLLSPEDKETALAAFKGEK